MREARRDRLRLQLMLDACDAVTEFITGRIEEDLINDKMLVSAVTRQIEIIGEAANMITHELRSQHPEVPWKQIIGMRHKIIHEYFAVQTDTVWDVIQSGTGAPGTDSSDDRQFAGRWILTMAEKIAHGRLNKFFKESTLLQQEFIKDNKMNVEQYLKSQDKDLTATDLKRHSLTI